MADYLADDAAYIAARIKEIEAEATAARVRRDGDECPVCGVGRLAAVMYPRMLRCECGFEEALP